MQVFAPFVFSAVLILSLLSGSVYVGCLVSNKDQRQTLRSITCIYQPSLYHFCPGYFYYERTLMSQKTRQPFLILDNRPFRSKSGQLPTVNIRLVRLTLLRWPLKQLLCLCAQIPEKTACELYSSQEGIFTQFCISQTHRAVRTIIQYKKKVCCKACGCVYNSPPFQPSHVCPQSGIISK
jgi:hypothetical protein